MALNIDKAHLVAARNLGSVAFAHGRVDGAEMLTFLAGNIQEINQRTQADHPYWRPEKPPVLRSNMVERARRDFDALKAKHQEGKRRFVGRAIATAVQRELSPDFARSLSTMAPEALQAAVSGVRDRILSAE